MGVSDGSVKYNFIHQIIYFKDKFKLYKYDGNKKSPVEKLRKNISGLQIIYRPKMKVLASLSGRLCLRDIWTLSTVPVTGVPQGFKEMRESEK